MYLALTRAFFSLLTRGDRANNLTILQFHKVLKNYDPLMPRELTLKQFELLLDFFAQHMRVLPLSEAIAALEKGNLPPRSVALTADDGYAEWIDVVAPALRARDMPATFFVATEQFDGAPLWHERIISAVRVLPDHDVKLPTGFFGYQDLSDQAIRTRLALHLQERFKYVRLPERIAAIELLEAQATLPLVQPAVFDSKSVRHLHRLGFEIGAHTIRHPILNRTTDDEAREEIGGSREELESIIRGPVTSFAYPNGIPGRDFSQRHVDIAKSCGYRSAVITGGGVARHGANPLMLPRFTPWGPGSGKIAYQMARNMRSKVFSFPHNKENAAPPKVLIVENGAGFGGAIIALQTLLSQASPTSNFHLVVNLPVGNFQAIPSVRSRVIIGDRVIDFRAIARAVKANRWLLGQRCLLFVIGRLDDVINRFPYLLRLAWHTFRVNPDIIHGNNEPSSNREAMLIAKLFGKPYVQHVRGAIATSPHTPWLLKRPDAFIPVSRWLAEELALNGVPNNCIHQIYDAVDLTVEPVAEGTVDIRQQYGLPPETILIAMVGMLVAWKGQDVFIEAVARIAQRMTGVAFLVIGGTPELGDSSYAESLVELAKRLGLEDKIVFTGRRNDMKAVMKQLDIVVSASTEPEPLGLVMLEALVNHCIFVGPAHGAAVEIIRDGDNGFLFEPQSSESLAEKLEVAVDLFRSKRCNLEQIGAEIEQVFGERKCLNSTEYVYSLLRKNKAF